MKTKIEEYLLDFVENELSAAEATSVAAEIRGSAELQEELANLEAVRMEVKLAESPAWRAVDFEQLHNKIMSQIDADYVQTLKKK